MREAKTGTKTRKAKAGDFLKHLRTVAKHRKYVRRACFSVGLYWQGIVHDLSKYSPAEIGMWRYYSGTRSPHQNCREDIGYSPSWIHHYHVNKHHNMYWVDTDDEDRMIPIKMPYRYVVESVCDMLGASKAYHGAEWREEMLLEYWEEKCEGKRLQHEKSLELTRRLLRELCERGEGEFSEWYRENKRALREEYERE